MEGFLFEALKWSALIFVLTNFARVGMYMFIPPIYHWIEQFICWKCWSLWIVLLVSFDPFLAATTALISALLDSYMSNKTIEL